MAVYNGQPFLFEAINSVLQQSFDDFEFIIINDGSQDDTEEIIASFSDQRIHCITNEKNCGLTVSLNKGLTLCRGDYVARFDSDDICMPDRFAAQVSFLNAHSDVGICGSWADIISEQGRHVARTLTQSNDIKCALLFGNVLVHSSVMFRRIIHGKKIRYNKSFDYAEDYELWTRMSNVALIRNIPKPLVRYREHTNQKTNTYSNKHQEKVYKEVRKLLKAQLHLLGIHANNENISNHLQLVSLPFTTWLNNMNSDTLHLWLIQLCEANKKNLVYQEDTFFKTLAKRWLFYCDNLTDCETQSWCERTAYWLDILNSDAQVMPEERYALASLYKRINQYSKAISIFNTFVPNESDPLYSSAQFHLGEIYHKKKQLEKARRHLLTCCKFNPEHLAAQELLYKIGNCKVK